MKPDASHHDPRPEYLRSRIQRAGLSQRQAADRIGISERLLRYYLVAENTQATAQRHIRCNSR
ncbi:hypothetical protein [Xanthomonas citri]|uniref:hypothetical protein n=1 Tax=Xanthomonas citri TaxID=346 RepID=UPI001F1F39B1|nr:hypothetical protein [Xanthomonas citri]